jgi:hypothetical protein
MIIEKGKLYRTRGGYKVEVLTTDRNECRPVVVMFEDGNIEVLYQNGSRWNDKSESELDLIAEWTEPVEIPWSDYPTWCKWVAMDENGKWYGFTSKPFKTNIFWVGDDACYIPEDYTPHNFTGDWTESLFERP